MRIQGQRLLIRHTKSYALNTTFKLKKQENSKTRVPQACLLYNVSSTFQDCNFW